VLRDHDLSLELIRLSEYDDLEAVETLPHGHWPEFLFHTPATLRYWPLLTQRFPECQLAIRDLETGQLVGTANTVPFALGDGDLGQRHDGWDGVLQAGTTGAGADTLSALNVLLIPSHRRPGAADFVLGAMKAIARERGYDSLVAPVRPTLKHRYPLVSFERYARWQRQDGTPFDPWVRRHVALGGAIVGPALRSMRVDGTVADWERWTGMRLPESGSYVVDGGLVPVEVDRAADRAVYVEPNLWIRHAVADGVSPL
jgi:hypothetical protein